MPAGHGEAASIQQPAGMGSFAKGPLKPQGQLRIEKRVLGRKILVQEEGCFPCCCTGSARCQEFGGGNAKGGLSSGAMLFLYKATQGNVSLDTAGMKSRKQIFSITTPRG